MKKKVILVLTLSLLPIISFTSSAEAICSTSKDRWGNTSGSIGGKSFSTSTDRWGNTSGSIGGQSYRSSTDRWGNTSGSIGGKSFSCSTDRWGNTSCRGFTLKGFHPLTSDFTSSSSLTGQGTDKN